MRRLATIFLLRLLLMLLLGGLPILAGAAPTVAYGKGDGGGRTQDDAEKPPRQAVILHVNRNLELKGYVESEDDDVITIRTLKDELETFSKTRVLQIIRLVTPAPKQTGIVVMRDGQTREGIIIEDTFDHVLMEIEGIRAKLKRADVSHVILEPSVLERYQQFKQTLQPGMSLAHLELCQWLLERKEYELARKELLELIENAPDMAEARQLLRVVEAQLALNRAADAAGGTEPGAGAEGEAAQPAQPDRAGPVTTADLMPDKIISSDDVNIIRVYELDFDQPPKVVISPDLVRELIEKYGTNKLVPASQTGRNAMFRAAADRPIEIVRLMFELRARELYPKIEVKTEPHALNLFRQRVHDTWLINRCATTSCHGSPFAGRFFLHRRNYKDERVRYTNLLILDQLQLDPQWPLVNYDDPEMSLIIQYAMGDAARKPHPKVDGYEPAFRSSNERLKQDAVEWIRAMYVPRPQYPVEYEPPVLGPGFAPVEEKPAGRPPR